MTIRLSATRLFGCRWLPFIVIAFLVLFLQSAPSYSYDESKFCAVGAERVVVFVDVTTPFDERSKFLFEEGIFGILSHMKGGQRIHIITIEDAFSTSQRLYEGCVPYCPPGGFWDLFTSDCTAGLIRLRTKEQQKKIGAALRSRLIHTEELPKSEIVRTIAFNLKSLLRDGGPSRIFIFSDMIENSDFLPGKIFHSTQVPELISMIKGNDLVPSIKGAHVSVFGVGRGGNLGRKPLPQPMLNHIVEFWTAYFKNAGAVDVYIGESLAVD